MADMAGIRAILLSVCTEELAEYEYECETDSDMVEEFLPFFLLEDKFKSRERAVRIQGYAQEVVPNYSLSTFREHFRLTPETFEELVCELGNCPEIPLGHSLGGRPPILIDKQLLIFLWFLGTQEYVRSISDRFNVKKSSVHVSCQRVCDAIKNNLAEHLIKWPSGGRAVEVMEGFEEQERVPAVIGAIDGSHIPIRAPRECPENYINRKDFHSIVLQACCDHEMFFTNCYCGWPGSVHDSRVLRNSDIFYSASNRHDDFFPNNSHLLGDAAYPLQTWIMTPYKDNGHLTEQQKTYNHLLSSTRMVIERAFALLKGQFRRLKYVDIDKVDDIPKIVIVACVLHNINLCNEDSFLDFMDDQDDEVNGYESILTPNTPAVQKCTEIMEYLTQ